MRICEIIYKEIVDGEFDIYSSFSEHIQVDGVKYRFKRITVHNKITPTIAIYVGEEIINFDISREFLLQFKDKGFLEDAIEKLMQKKIREYLEFGWK